MNLSSSRAMSGPDGSIMISVAPAWAMDISWTICRQTFSTCGSREQIGSMSVTSPRASTAALSAADSLDQGVRHVYVQIAERVLREEDPARLLPRDNHVHVKRRMHAGPLLPPVTEIRVVVMSGDRHRDHIGVLIGMALQVVTVPCWNRQIAADTDSTRDVML
jgi:hypothetical protein